MRIGDLLEVIFKYTGIRWLVKKIVIDWLGYESCGCEERKDVLNNIDWDLKWKDNLPKKSTKNIQK